MKDYAVIVVCTLLVGCAHEIVNRSPVSTAAPMVTCDMGILRTTKTMACRDEIKDWRDG